MNAFNALRAHLETEFTALPIYWQNDARDPSSETAGFILAECAIASEEPISIGQDTQRTHRETGTFTVNVFVPIGSKPGIAEQHAQAIRDSFKPRDVTGVTIVSRVVGRGRQVNKPGARYAVPVSMTWFADRTE